jgi:glycosyltransferase involved in cell wall biosynthesis
MKILFFTHRLELGGSQTNALDLASRLSVGGHEPIVFGAPGPAVALAEQRELPYREAPDPKRHPSLQIMRALADVVERERPDLVHAWEWPQAIDAFYGAGVRPRVPLLVTSMATGYVRAIPPSVPLTAATPAVVEESRLKRRGPVWLLAPPVDTVRNAPGAVDEEVFRREHGVSADSFLIVLVSRLGEVEKAEGIERAIHATQVLGAAADVALAIVGDGPARARLQQLGDEVNARCGERRVVFTGAVNDPRTAYAAADLVLGMGGSVLRGMAFAKPAVVLGEQGFAMPLTHESAPRFIDGGWYGLGRGDVDAGELVADLQQLVADPARRRELGALGRQIVLEEYGLDHAAESLSSIYATVSCHPVNWSRALAAATSHATYLTVTAARGGLRDRRRPAVPERAASARVHDRVADDVLLESSGRHT